MRQCSICSHPDLPTIQRLVADGVSLGELVLRFPSPPITKASLSRHMRSHLPRGNSAPTQGRRLPKNAKPIKGDKGSRIASEGSRCSRCGQITDDQQALEPQALVRRAERLLNIAEGIALRAEADSDNGCA